VAETCAEPKRGALGRAAREIGFEIERTIVEAEGVCTDCRTPGA
jgi:Fur family zinc uptake transcriptional regulator